jgi:hypothetical protein
LAEGGLIFDLRSAIADLSKCALARQLFQIENRKSQIQNPGGSAAETGL